MNNNYNTLRNNPAYICNAVKASAEKYCQHYTKGGVTPEFYEALYETHCKVLEIVGTEETTEVRFEKLNKYLKNRARTLQAKYKRTDNSDYSMAADSVRNYIDLNAFRW